MAPEVFGINFEVTDHGQIFPHVAKDDETIRQELTFPQFCLGFRIHAETLLNTFNVVFVR